MLSGRRTISDNEVMNGIKLCFPEALALKAEDAAESALKCYASADATKGTSRHTKANLILPPSVPEKFLRNFGTSKLMVTQSAPITLCACIEEAGEQILQAAADLACEKGKVRLTVRDLELTVRNNEEFNDLFKKNAISFIGGGAVPFIHPLLKRKKTRRRRKDPNHDNPITKHRYKPGTVALRDIKRFQKVSDCLILAKAPFEKLIRTILSTKGSDATKISKQVFIILQYYLESRLVDVLHKANLAAIHAGRIKVLPDDIDFVVSLERGTKSMGLLQLEESTSHTTKVRPIPSE
jgi:histone H3/H4